jgi:hypothetical protein
MGFTKPIDVLKNGKGRRILRRSEVGWSGEEREDLTARSLNTCFVYA